MRDAGRHEALSQPLYCLPCYHKAHPVVTTRILVHYEFLEFLQTSFSRCSRSIVFTVAILGHGDFLTAVLATFVVALRFFCVVFLFDHLLVMLLGLFLVLGFVFRFFGFVFLHFACSFIGGCHIRALNTRIIAASWAAVYLLGARRKISLWAVRSATFLPVRPRLIPISSKGIQFLIKPFSIFARANYQSVFDIPHH